MSAFPSSPSDGDEFSLGDRVFSYNASLNAWRVERTASSGATILSREGAQVVASTADFDLRPAIGAIVYSEADDALYIFNGAVYLDPVSGDTVPLAPDFENMAIGTATSGGFFAGIMDTTTSNIISADDYQTGERYALIVSPKDYEGGDNATPASGLPTGDLAWDSAGRGGQTGSLTRWNGLESTNSILSQNDTQYEVFEFIRTLRTAYPVPEDLGSDWYLPAMDELSLLYRNLAPSSKSNNNMSRNRNFPGAQTNGYNPSSDPTESAYASTYPPQTSVSIFQSGGAQAMDLLGYWSSTDANDQSRAWSQYFDRGGYESWQFAYPKTTTVEFAVRAVRRFII